MEENKNIPAEGESVTPEAPAAEPPVADAPAPDLNTGPAAPQEQDGITPTDPGDVVVSFDKIEELMAERRAAARAAVEQAPAKAKKSQEAAKPRKGRPPKAAWRQRLMDFGTLDADIERQLEETQVVAKLVKAAVKENASTAQSQETYLKKYEALTKRYETAAAELERLQSLRASRSQQDKIMALYIRTLKKQPEVMHDWNDTIWTVMIKKAIVHRNGKITFVFNNGTEIQVGA